MSVEQPRSPAAFVGRERELAELSAGLEFALGGRGGLYLVSGEPGIGKTRLAGEFASAAGERGARVIWARAWEGGGAPAYWPWVQLLRSYVLSADRYSLAAHLDAGAPYLAELVPEIRERVPEVPHPPALVDSENARFHLLDALASFLKAAASVQPLVLILEDLHSADRASLVALEYLARELEGVHLLVVGTHRPRVGAAGSPHPMPRQSRSISLGGLAPDDVAQLVEQRFGFSASEKVAATIHEITAGNPLFVEEVARLMIAEGRPEDPASVVIPPEVLDVIRRRLEPLEAVDREVLTVAAVLGREFSLGVLERVTGMSRTSIAQALAGAGRRGLVAAAPASLGTYSFAHTLIREALYEDLAPEVRGELHQRVGEALERTYDRNAEHHAAELAHHFCRAALAGDESKAVRYSILAGERAAMLMAFEEAAEHYRRALEASDLGAPDLERRGTILAGLGDALWRAGDAAGAKAVLLEAAAIARTTGDAVLLARAALGYGTGLGGQGFTFNADEELIGLLEQALEALGNEPSGLRIRVLSRLAVELSFTDRAERRVALSEEAVEAARSLADPAVELVALYSRLWAVMSPDNLDERLAAADEIVRLAEKAGDREMLYRGRQLRFLTLTVLSDFPAADAEMRECRRLADELGMPLYRWQMATYDAGRALMDGHLDDYERGMREAFELGSGALAEPAALVLGSQMAVLGWVRGNLEQMLPLLAGMAERNPWLTAAGAALAIAYAETGHVTEARLTLEHFSVNGFRGIRRDALWLPSLWFLTFPCAFLGAADHARTLYEMLLPHAEETVLLGTNLGPVAFSLGLLAATMGRAGDAVEHFEQAVRRNEQWTNRPLLALSLREQGAALLDRRRPGDLAAAQRVLGRAIDLIREMGVDGFAARAEELLARCRSEDEARVTIVEKDADRWEIVFGGRGVLLPITKGLRYLRELLRHPGRERHALELVAAGADGTGERQRSSRELDEAGLSEQGDLGPLIDPEARAAYRQRLADLEKVVEEARAWEDHARAARAQEELDAITGELGRSLGLGGRDRIAGAAAERARVNVTRAIRAVIDRAAAEHPALGEHLRTAVKTGTFCSYEPPSA